MTAIITCNALSFSYGQHAVLHTVTLSVRHGEWISLLGPNGSGKTTLLKLISGWQTPSSGTITIDDQPSHMLTPRDRAKMMAIVPQDQTISFPYSAFEIVMMGRAPFWSGFGFDTLSDRQSCEKAMKLTDTWHLKDRNIQTLSGGERQRILIARALAQEPSILILDEPTSHLDIHHQTETGSLLKKLNRDSGLTIISVMHDINLAALYSDTVALMKEGRIIAHGPPTSALSYATIKTVFETEVYVGINDVTGAIYYLPMGQ